MQSFGQMNGLLRGMRGLKVVALVAAAGMFAVGCAAARPTPLHFTVRHVAAVDRLTAMRQARDALESRGFPTARFDVDRGQVTSEPLLESRRSAPGLSSVRAALRRVAQVRIEDGAEGVYMYCRVVIQEQATAAHQIVAQDRRSSDLPAVTPIERDASTTDEQNSVWSTVGRDKAEERAILENMLGGNAEATRGPGPSRP